MTKFQIAISIGERRVCRAGDAGRRLVLSSSENVDLLLDNVGGLLRSTSESGAEY